MRMRGLVRVTVMGSAFGARDRTYSSCSVSAALRSPAQTFQYRSAVGRAKSRVGEVNDTCVKTPGGRGIRSLACSIHGAVRSANCSADGIALLEFSGNITNFAAVSTQNSFQGWVNGTDPCQGWTGVTCNTQDLVTSLNMSSYGFKGYLADGLNGLTGLVNLSLSNNSFEGSLPSAWGWTPKLQLLQNLYLDQNPNLNATLPTAWGSPGGFSSLQVLNISGSNITGALPLTWGSPGALPALVKLELGHNSITGTLPTYWSTSNSLPQLRSLGLTDNLLNGSLPGEWGSQAQAFPSLEVLNVALNNLTGSLPSTWCGQGFPSLSELYVQNNNVSGTLPSTWGATECFASLATLALHNNSLSGSVPTSWGVSTSFASLADMVILPGNPGICGSVPGTLEAAQLTPNGSTVLTATSFGVCPEVSNAAAPIPAEAKVNSSNDVLVALVPRNPRRASPDAPEEEVSATAPTPTEILLAPLPPTPPSSPSDVNLTVGLNLAGGSSLLPYTNTTKQILVAAFRKSVNDDGQVQLLSVQAPATSATASPTTVYNASSSSSARRLLQSASNVTATFGYTTSQAVASTFQSTFNTSQFNQALSVQGATGIQTILQNVDGLEAALAAPATAPAAAPVATPAATTIPVPAPASKKALGGGAIAGIAIGAGAGIALIAGALLWFCCWRCRQQKRPLAKWQFPKEEASSGPSWGAATLGFLGRPFRKSPPTNLVASKAVDLTPAMEDPERPSFDSFSTKELHPTAPQPSSVDFYMQQLPADNQSDIPPLVQQDLAGAVAAGAVVAVHNEALHDKSAMAHSDSAVSLPHSNASSVQAPGTPVAPAVANTVRDNGSSSESKSESENSAASSARPTNPRGNPQANLGMAYVGPAPGRRPEKQVMMKPASHSAYQASSSRDARPGMPRQGTSPARHRKGSNGLAAYPSGDLAGRSERERLLALSRRARRALERELHASHQQRSNSGSAPNRSSSVQPAGQGASSRPQEGQGPSRDANRPQEGPRPADRRPGGRSGPQARQKELSDRAIKILEELTSLGRQGSVPSGQQMSREQAAGISNGRAGRETQQQLMRQHSELPFHSSGRTNPNPERRPQTPNPISDRSRSDSRSKQKASADPQAASGGASEARGLDKHHSSGQSVSRYGSSTSNARLEQRSSSRQHSRQKSRPSSARP
ncbi:hypothetical protein WJX79_001051 [Trebouxia sp. C0005]